jgi:ribonucleotide reductase alpha subunit
VHQKAAFNSPVWFNVGIEKHPQASACFINSVEDKMESILGLARTEGMLFKFGSGTGSNLSSIRSSREPLAGGGTASGPVSFMRGYDAFAGVIKSGGKTRRAAKMVILDAVHPDIVDFIHSKADEERKAWALIEAGYDGAFNVRGGAYDSVFFQNANHSVRVTDEFMKAVAEDDEWQTKYVLSGEPCEKHRARDLLKEMAEAAWQCGDPGVQFDTTVNDWHTCPNSARINASNPCVTGDTHRRHARGHGRGLAPHRLARGRSRPDRRPRRAAAHGDTGLPDRSQAGLPAPHQGGLRGPDHWRPQGLDNGARRRCGERSPDRREDPAPGSRLRSPGSR